MKNFNKVCGAALSLALLLNLVGPFSAFAATTPSLSDAAAYVVLASTYTNTSATTLSGSVGFTTGPAVAPLGTHASYGSGAPYSAAGTAQGSALANLNSQACSFSFASGAINLSTDTTHGAIGVYTPGVYCVIGAMDVGGPLTLSGNGTFIFRSTGALTSTAGAIVSLAGGSACDVFWTPGGATTLAANTTFVGTVIDDAGVTVGANTNWTGQALAYGGTVTTDTDTISVPSCAAAVEEPPAVTTGTLSVIKQVTNNNSGTSVAADFNLHVKLSGSDVASSPAVGLVAPGRSYTLTAGTYTVSEDANTAYTASFSGDCDSSGNVTMNAGSNLTCTITNDDVAVAAIATTGTITVTKVVVNTGGGTAVVGSFPLFINGTSATSGVAATLAAPAAYTVTETASTNYTGVFSGDCNASGVIDLAVSENATCTLTNTYTAPAVDAAPEVLAPVEEVLIEEVADAAPVTATAPVVIPTLPDTGLAPFSKFLLALAVLSGLCALGLFASVTFKKTKI
jgi:hypothetical protein